MRSLPDDNLSYPVLIQLEDGSSGSGFFLNYGSQKQFLVTALHVLFDLSADRPALRCSRAKLTSYDRDLSIIDPVEIEIDLRQLPIKKDDSNDLVLVQIANLMALEESGRYGAVPLQGVQRIQENEANLVGVAETSLKGFDEVLVSNDVFILGYPNSLGIPDRTQIEYGRPLLRKGIVAGKNYSNRTIILDCPVYFGNSGGLAIEVEEIYKPGIRAKYQIIGIVSQYIPFVERLESKQLGYTNVNFENSGYSIVVPTDTILGLAGP